MRSLTTLRIVNKIEDIENADRIQLAVVDGWTVIIKKGEFKEGDVGVFFEIDSFLPASDNRYEFLLGRGTKKIGDHEGFRIRTQKMRGVLSQGLILPLHLYPEVTNHLKEIDRSIDDVIEEAYDFSDLLNIIKFERPEPKAPNASGNFPSFLQKTDEPRIQNCYRRMINNIPSDASYYPTLKLDGSSTTVAFVNRDTYGEYYKWEDDALLLSQEMDGQIYDVIACSRNLQIKSNPDSHFIKSILNGNLLETIGDISVSLGGISLAIQGECIGPGIQGNPENLTDFQLYAFNIWDIDSQTYMPYSKSKDVFTEFGVMAVPLVAEAFNPFERFSNLEELLAFSDGESLNAKWREGIVYKSDDHSSFKVISNRWLLDSRNA